MLNLNPIEMEALIKYQQQLLKKANEDIANLRTALQYYTEATVVDNWGQQELSDDGHTAREALGWPHPTGHEFNMKMEQSCDCDVCEAERELAYIRQEG